LSVACVANPVQPGCRVEPVPRRRKGCPLPTPRRLAVQAEPGSTVHREPKADRPDGRQARAVADHLRRTAQDWSPAART
jgi:hypothetical protein